MQISNGALRAARAWTKDLLRRYFSDPRARGRESKERMQGKIGAVLSRIAREFHDLALAKAENPNSLLNADVARLLITLQEFSQEEKLSPEVVFSTAADLTRPLFCTSWYFDRAFKKPRRYPGDYLLIQRIYDGSAASSGLAALLDRTFLASPSAQAVRNRREVLGNLLWKHLVSSNGQMSRILSLGSGPGQELVDLAARYRQVASPKGPSVTCVDIDPRALSHLRRRWRAESSLPITTIRADIRRFTSGASLRADFAYCIGLFDYLSDDEAIAVLNNIWALLPDTGTFVLGNLADRLPPEDRFCMEQVMQWHLVYRDEKALGDLITQSRFERAKAIVAEPQRIQLFAILQK